VTEEQIAIVEIYIGIRKGKDVRIRYPRTAKELMLLQKAYSIADRWLDNHNAKINRI